MSYEVDNICLKSVSDKRWVKKVINEAAPEWYDLSQLDDTIKKILLSYKNFFNYNNSYNKFVYKLDKNILTVYSIKSGSPSISIVEKNSNPISSLIDSNINEYKEFYSLYDLSPEYKITKFIDMSDDEYKKRNTNINRDNIIHGTPFVRFSLNLNNGEYDFDYNFIYAINKDLISPNVFDMLSYLFKNYNCDFRAYDNSRWAIFNEIIYPMCCKIQPDLKYIAPLSTLSSMMKTFSYDRLYKRLYHKEYIISKDMDKNFKNDENNKINNQTTIEIKTDANLDKTYDYENNINGKKTKKQHQKSLRKYKVDIDNSPSEKDNVTMHLLSKKSDKDNKNDIKVLPFLYTNEVITDERARTYVDVCNMVSLNVEKIEDNLYSENFGKTLVCRNSNIKKYIKGDDDDNKSPELGDFSDNREALGAKKLKVATASTQDKSQLRRISVRVCDCYLDAMKKSKEKDFTSDYEDSAGLNYNLHLYLVEVLSALAVCACPKNCTWQEKTKNSGLPEFKKHVGVDENTSDFTNICYISFPEASNFPLADSVIYINGVRTYLSTKGGAKAEGANPSIKTLSEFVYGEDGKILTYLTDGVIKKYPNEFSIFLELLKGSVSTLNFDKINSIIGCSTLYDLENWLEMNKDIMSYIIMEILQAQSFQFMQAKCSATSMSNDFHFNYSIQYPAVFDGDVDILFEKGKIKFHIANQELQES